MHHLISYLNFYWVLVLEFIHLWMGFDLRSDDYSQSSRYLVGVLIYVSSGAFTFV